MTVKVEMQKMPEKGIVAFAFEASSEADLEIVDNLAEVFFSSYKKSGGYSNGRRFVLHVHDPLLKEETKVNP